MLSSHDKRPLPEEEVTDASNKRSRIALPALDQDLLLDTSNGVVPCCSTILALTSTYFKTALTTPLGEAIVDAEGRRRISMREFTRQDVALLIEIVTLHSAISVSNVHTLLPLFDFLGMDAAMRQADGVICAALGAVDAEGSPPAQKPPAPKLGWWTRAQTAARAAYIILRDGSTAPEPPAAPAPPVRSISRNAPARLGQMRHSGFTLVEWLGLACKYKLPRTKAECIVWILSSPGEFVSELTPIVTSDEHADVLAALWPALRPALLLPSQIAAGEMAEPPSAAVVAACWPALALSVKRWQVLGVLPFTGYCAVSESLSGSVVDQIKTEACGKVRTVVIDRLQRMFPGYEEAKEYTPISVSPYPGPAVQLLYPQSIDDEDEDDEDDDDDDDDMLKVDSAGRKRQRAASLSPS